MRNAHLNQNIPIELVHEILKNLKKKELKSAILVCKQWSSIAVDLVWKSMTIQGRSYIKTKSTLHKFVRALKAHDTYKNKRKNVNWPGAPLIRNLVINDHELTPLLYSAVAHKRFGYFFNYRLSGLRTLKICGGRNCGSRYLELVLNFPELESLTILESIVEANFVNWCLFENNPDARNRLIQIFLNLKHLEISGNNNIANCSSFFSHLPICLNVASLRLRSVSLKFAKLVSGKFPNVKDFRVYFSDVYVSQTLLPDLTQLEKFSLFTEKREPLPHVKSLKHLEFAYSFEQSVLLRCIETRGAELFSLVLPESNFPEQVLKHLIRFAPDLRAFGMRTFAWNVDQALIAELFTKCKNLKTIAKFSGEFISVDFQKLCTQFGVRLLLLGQR